MPVEHLEEPLQAGFALETLLAVLALDFGDSGLRRYGRDNAAWVLELQQLVELDELRVAPADHCGLITLLHFELGMNDILVEAEAETTSNARDSQLTLSQQRKKKQSAEKIPD